MTSKKKYKVPKQNIFSRIKFFLLFLVIINGIFGYFLWNFTSENETLDASDPLTTVTEPVVVKSEEADTTAQEPVLTEEKDNTHTGVISSGDTASTLLQEWMPVADVNALAEASKGLFPLRGLREGQPYIVHLNDAGVEKFEYEIDDLKKLIITRDEANGFAAHIEKIPYEVLLEQVNGVIESSLFEAVANLGESPTLAIRLADIFAWEINFVKDLRQGDTFSLLVEKNFRDGEFKRYGKVLSATFVNQNKEHNAFAFVDNKGATFYYSEAGESLKRAFLQAPLSFTRISSGFTARRLHPILKEWRAHPAIDYAAPSGTPVKAVGSGVVQFAGWGTGAGNYISLKHSSGYETMYLHLSGFARGLKKGAKVSQGEVIGFVGSTGYSTGPHLDFRMKKNGSFINPASALNPRADGMDKGDLKRFKEMVAYYKSFLNGKKSLTEYAPFESLK